ncbi:MAG: phosphonate metabolism protein/1,5-bisphosphokinase (PRPP-forming) PhnN [Devosia nanyangense]|uniref:Ribose 1,5-bisphosphate phosphokinase PhnN n=1 Tax=Devosia nanyangense TaxID=1228055 RepID=A0A933KZR9_9HYPH|nr:phosphonate metabolism protein/1,5-bisphosphokinase (PRPP-forming) PhnN [Devosia nanyangense]
MQQPGTLVLVVGPSGAGKDTLIAAAREALRDDPRYAFPRRVVTREAVAALEDHDSVTAEQFALRERHGAYALAWEAHGLRYGLPATLVDDLAAGRIVVVNASRAMTAAAAEKFPGTRVLLIDAAPEVRAGRLAGRGRETAAAIAERLGREVPAPLPGAIRIDNSGALADGIASFLAALRAITGN